MAAITCVGSGPPGCINSDRCSSACCTKPGPISRNHFELRNIGQLRGRLAACLLSGKIGDCGSKESVDDDEQAREALFISHANPEDNAFTLWLGAKLAALGYQVFADVLRLRGGDDWERVLEDAIRNKAAKFLLVATPYGVQKQGVRNEITIATETSKRIDEESIYRSSPPGILLMRHCRSRTRNTSTFQEAGREDFSELLALLSETAIPQPIEGANAEMWRSVQLKDARSISSVSERLVSNWLPVESVTGTHDLLRLQERHLARQSPEGDSGVTYTYRSVQSRFLVLRTHSSTARLVWP